MKVIQLASQIGSLFSYQIKSDIATVFGAENLPSGWTCNPATGVISGVVPPIGRFSIAIMAATKSSSSFATLDITATPPPVPVITNADTVSVPIGAAFSYQITASSATPITSYSATNLPAWASLNSTTGVISGTPGVDLLSDSPLNYTSWTSGSTGGSGFGVWSFNNSGAGGQFLADLPSHPNMDVEGSFGFGLFANSGGIGRAERDFQNPMVTGNSFTVRLDNNWVDNNGEVGFYLLDSSGNTRFRFYFVGGESTYKYQDSSGTQSSSINYIGSGFTCVFTLTSPTAYTFSVGNQSFSGTISSATQISKVRFENNNSGNGFERNLYVGRMTHTRAVTQLPTESVTVLGATNANGTGTKSALVKVNFFPIITSAATATAQKNVSFSYQIVATGNPTSYSAANLPSGLTLNSSTGLISGSPTVSGASFTVTLTASSSVFTSNPFSLVFTINSLPYITSPLTASANYNQAFSYQLASSEYPAATSFGASNLPQGLSINTSTGLITGTPTMSYSSPVPVSVTCTNPIGTATATLNLTVVGIQTTVANHLVEVMDGSWDPGSLPRVEQTGYVYCIGAKDALYVSSLNSATQWTKIPISGINPAGLERWGGRGFRLWKKDLIGTGPTANISTAYYDPFVNNNSSYQYPTIGSKIIYDAVATIQISDSNNFFTLGPSSVRLNGLNTGYNTSAGSVGFCNSRFLAKRYGPFDYRDLPSAITLKNRKSAAKIFYALSNNNAYTDCVVVSKPVTPGSYSFARAVFNADVTWSLTDSMAWSDSAKIDGERGYSEIEFADNGVIMVCGGAYNASKAPGEKTMAVRYLYYSGTAYLYLWFTFEVDPNSSFDSSNLYYFPATDRIYVTYGPNVFSCSAAEVNSQVGFRTSGMTSLGFSWISDTHPGTDPAGFPSGSRAFAKRLSQTANGGSYALVRYLGAEGAYPFQVAIGDSNRTNWQISTITS